jgi:hypothetical protein
VNGGCISTCVRTVRLHFGALETVATTYYVAHSAAGEEMIGLPNENLNECGTSYEDRGYKWGAWEVR